MRFVGMLSMTALILTGLPPAPIGPAPADAQSAARTRRILSPDNDPDARCAPFLRETRYEDRVALGRGRRYGGVTGYSPPPPPAPPPPIQYSPPSPADQSVAVTGSRVPSAEAQRGNNAIAGVVNNLPATRYQPPYVPSPENRERYAGREVSSVLAVADQPVSTFSVDVDTGAYSNVRRMLNQGQMPPEGAVRTEETSRPA